jgi:hypothetical protein
MASPTAAPIYPIVCAECGQDFQLAYRLADRVIFICTDCEEAALLAGVRRRALLRSLLLAIVCVLAIGVTATLLWGGQVVRPRDAVAPHE